MQRSQPLVATRAAAVVVRGGVVVEVLGHAAGLRRVRAGAREVDCSAQWLTPGLVNAHAHLELSALAGQLEPGPNFAAWVRALIQVRGAWPRSGLARAKSKAFAQLSTSGTTAVVDIDSLGLGVQRASPTRLRVLWCREVLDAFDSSRTRAASARIERALQRRALCTEGVAPHASFTVSPELLAHVARIAVRRSLACTIHWSETEHELLWLERGLGPLAEVLGPSPKRSGLDLLAQAGLLGPRLILVHGNHPGAGEMERVAAARALLVHCPGSHAWFQRAPFPLARYLKAGVRVALGTDSLASNAELDMRREMALMRRSFAWLEPERVFSMATQIAGEAFLGPVPIGVLEPGARADIAAWNCPSAGARPFLDAVTACAGTARAGTMGVRTWLGGR